MDTTHSDWIAAIPALRSLESDSLALLRASVMRVDLPKGKVIFRPGDECGKFPFVASGCVRVQRLTDSGREIVLYRVAPNETCILSVASLISADLLAAEAVAETDVVAHVLPAPTFKALMNASEVFRGFVFGGYSQRIATLMSKIEEIACVRIDVRLAERLLHLRASGGAIATTQQALAADLGTAREVVGRALKQFENFGWVSVSRGAVELTDAGALSRLVAAARD